MSREISFNHALRAGKRKLQIQTAFVEEENKVRTSISDNNQLVDVREWLLDDSLEEANRETEVKQYHDFVVSDLDLLFHVIEKVVSGKNPDSLFKLGTLFLEKGFFNEAIDAFTTLLAESPDYANVHFYLGQAYFRFGDTDQALYQLQQAIHSAPGYPDIHLLLAEVYRKINDPLQSIKCCENAIALHPDYLRAHLFLGLVLAESALQYPTHSELPPPIERLRESKQHLLYALSQVSEEKKQHIETGIECLDTRERLEEGIREIEKTIEPAPSNHKSLVADSEFYLKFMFSDLDRNHRVLDNYIKTLDKAINQHPEYADLQHSLGTAYLLRGWHDFARALEAYREAVRINPGFKKAQKNLKLLENDGRGFLILLRAILK